MNQLPGLY